MYQKRRKIAALLGLASLMLVTACTTPVLVKDVTNDKAGYMSLNFSPDTLATSVKQKIPATSRTAGGNKLVLTREATNVKVSATDKPSTWKSTVTLVDIGNGYVQRMEEVANNDVPYALFYSLTQHGIIDLKWQSVLYRYTHTEPRYEVKEYSRFDPLPINANGEAVVNYKTGLGNQQANFYNAQQKCKTVRTFAAADLHKKLTGKATELDCELLSDNIVKSRTKWAYMADYGTAIQIENATSTARTTFRITDVALN